MGCMPWFKHYNNSHEGETIANLWASKDYELIAFYWTVLELVGRWENYQERGVITINLSTFKMKLNMNSQRSTKLLLKLSQTFKVRVEQISGESYKLSVDNWLKLQETRGVKKFKKIDEKPLDDRREKRDGRNRTKENVFFDFELVYQNYPLKLGKSLGFLRASEIIKNEKDFNDFKQSVLNYKKYNEEKKTEPEFIKHFSSFVGTKKNQPWRDWIAPQPDTHSLAQSPENKIIYKGKIYTQTEYEEKLKSESSE